MGKGAPQATNISPNLHDICFGFHGKSKSGCGRIKAWCSGGAVRRPQRLLLLELLFVVAVAHSSAAGEISQSLVINRSAIRELARPSP